MIWMYLTAMLTISESTESSQIDSTHFNTSLSEDVSSSAIRIVFADMIDGQSDKFSPCASKFISYSLITDKTSASCSLATLPKGLLPFPISNKFMMIT